MTDSWHWPDSSSPSSRAENSSKRFLQPLGTFPEIIASTLMASFYTRRIITWSTGQHCNFENWLGWRFEGCSCSTDSALGRWKWDRIAKTPRQHQNQSQPNQVSNQQYDCTISFSLTALNKTAIKSKTWFRKECQEVLETPFNRPKISSTHFPGVVQPLLGGTRMYFSFCPPRRMSSSMTCALSNFRETVMKRPSSLPKLLLFRPSRLAILQQVHLSC